MLTLDQNPAVRSSNVESIAEYTGDWYLGQTYAKMEKPFAFAAEAAGIPYFLPLAKLRKEYSGVKRTVLVPLFSSYVFFAGDLQTRYDALQTGKLCNVIPVVQRQKLVGELLQIERVIEMDLKIDLYPELVVGRWAVVRKGPLMGTRGVVIEDKGEFRLVLQVGMLGQGAGLEIDKELLEPI